MKLKYLEIVIATLFLLTNVYGLFGTADLYWRGNFSPDSFGAGEFKTHQLQFDFTWHYLIPNLVMYFSYYLSFIWMACSLPNRYLADRLWNKALATICLSFIITLSLFILSKYLAEPFGAEIVSKSLGDALNQALILYTVILFYQAAKQSWLWLSKDGMKPNQTRPIIAESAFFIITWFVVLSGCILFGVYWGFTWFAGLIWPCAFATYILNVYWIFPAFYRKNNQLQFWVLELATTLCINVPLNGYYSSRATNSETSFLMLFILLWLLQLCIVLPASYYLYQRRQNTEAELTGLRTHIDVADANLQLLISQINPHFLFNTLNTLYGMALMEKAENTGAGIQRLGDMMRFILHENNQDKIPLNREMAYLNDYIALQNLRITANPIVEVTLRIQENHGHHSISPMLLIPFIENAYKHGISLKQRSWIHISLSVSEDTLHFDVHNSIHHLKDDDPEIARSGIGLENVRQRLILLYPKKHELTIRQNSNEYFIHLNIQLQ
jgi:two-component system LytT family sensor kinase